MGMDGNGWQWMAAVSDATKIQQLAKRSMTVDDEAPNCHDVNLQGHPTSMQKSASVAIASRWPFLTCHLGQELDRGKLWITWQFWGIRDQ